MKRKATALDLYLREHGIEEQEFADKVSAAMPEKRPVSVSAVRKWRYGNTMPRKHALRAIVEATGGAVSAQSLVDAAA